MKKSDVLTPTLNKIIAEMTFSEAIQKIMEGKKVARLAWKPAKDYGLLKDGWLMIYTKGDFHVWKVNDGDMLSEDWIEVAEIN